MIGMRATRAAYYLVDSTLPFYVEFEFDASPFCELFLRGGVDPVDYKREMLLFKMFAVRKTLETGLSPNRHETLWRLYLTQMERILDLTFPRHKEAIKADLCAALSDYAAACPDPGPDSAHRVGRRFAARLGLADEERLVAYAANIFLRKCARAKRYLSGWIWF